MQIRTVRRPGERGTQNLMRKYGDKLVAVRYRYDAAGAKRYKTVELIVAEEDWTPPPPHPEETRFSAPTRTYYPAKEVDVRIRYDEKDLQSRIKAVGGKWDAKKKVWRALKERVNEIGLKDRIVR